MRIRQPAWRALVASTLLCISLATSAQATIDLQGHRGARGLLAENTLPSFALALQAGVSTLELDVLVTRDDVLVISHDPALNPDITRDAQGRFLSSKGPDIRQLTFEQLQSYDVGRINPDSRYAQTFSAQKGQDGVRIPRLKDLFELVKTHRPAACAGQPGHPIRTSFGLDCGLSTCPTRLGAQDDQGRWRHALVIFLARARCPKSARGPKPGPQSAGLDRERPPEHGPDAGLGGGRPGDRQTGHRS